MVYKRPKKSWPHMVLPFRDQKSIVVFNRQFGNKLYKRLFAEIKPNEKNEY